MSQKSQSRFLIVFNKYQAIVFTQSPLCPIRRQKTSSFHNNHTVIHDKSGFAQGGKGLVHLALYG